MWERSRALPTVEGGVCAAAPDELYYEGAQFGARDSSDVWDVRVESESIMGAVTFRGQETKRLK